MLFGRGQPQATRRTAAAGVPAMPCEIERRQRRPAPPTSLRCIARQDGVGEARHPSPVPARCRHQGDEGMRHGTLRGQRRAERPRRLATANSAGPPARWSGAPRQAGRARVAIGPRCGYRPMSESGTMAQPGAATQARMAWQASSKDAPGAMPRSRGVRRRYGGRRSGGKGDQRRAGEVEVARRGIMAAPAQEFRARQARLLKPRACGRRRRAPVGVAVQRTVQQAARGCRWWFDAHRRMRGQPRQHCRQARGRGCFHRTRRGLPAGSAVTPARTSSAARGAARADS